MNSNLKTILILIAIIKMLFATPIAQNPIQDRRQFPVPLNQNSQNGFYNGMNPSQNVITPSTANINFFASTTSAPFPLNFFQQLQTPPSYQSQYGSNPLNGPQAFGYNQNDGRGYNQQQPNVFSQIPGGNQINGQGFNQQQPSGFPPYQVPSIENPMNNMNNGLNFNQQSFFTTSSEPGFPFNLFPTTTTTTPAPFPFNLLQQPVTTPDLPFPLNLLFPTTSKPFPFNLF